VISAFDVTGSIAASQVFFAGKIGSSEALKEPNFFEVTSSPRSSGTPKSVPIGLTPAQRRFTP
jgi:hypothetical protein